MKYRLTRTQSLPTAKIHRESKDDIDGYIVDVGSNTKFIIPLIVRGLSYDEMKQFAEQTAKTLGEFLGRDRCLVVPVNEIQDLCIYELTPAE